MGRFRIQHRIFPSLPIDSIGNPLKLQKYHPPYHVIEKSIRFYFKCDLISIFGNPTGRYYSPNCGAVFPGRGTKSTKIMFAEQNMSGLIQGFQIRFGP